MPPVFKGVDDKGNSVGTHLAFWKAVKSGASHEGKPLWYKKGIEYWDTVEATDDGVLGGYGHVSTQDALDNTAFLETVFGDALEAKRTGSRRLVVNPKP
jgi:protein N-terminal methyltransferase